MPLFTDQIGRKVAITAFPKKIISLVPSQTELLYALGLEDRVAGITRFCVHPEHWRRDKKVVGGTKDWHEARIRQLDPDLILANKEENTRDAIEALWQDYPVWVSDIYDLSSAIEMIRQVASITNSTEEAEQLISSIQNDFERLPVVSLKRTAVYLIWKDPMMCVGGNNFINDMLDRAGFDNLLAEDTRYPVVTMEQVRMLNPEFILLSSEPYPFSEKHLKEYETLFPQSKILIVDGEMFSWYGSRLRLAPDYFQLLPPLSEGGRK